METKSISDYKAVTRRKLALLSIAVFFAAQYFLTQPDSVFDSVPLWLAFINLSLVAVSVSGILCAAVYGGTLGLLYIEHPLGIAEALWVISIGVLLLSVGRLAHGYLTRDQGESQRAVLEKILVLLALTLLVSGFAVAPVARGADRISLLLEFAGAFALTLQIAPMLLTLLFARKDVSASAAQRISALEHCVWWLVTAAVFAYVRIFGEYGTFLGLIDGSIILLPLIVWAALRFNLGQLSSVTILVPLAASYYQSRGVGGTPLSSLSFGGSGVTILTFTLVVTTWILYGWRLWMLQHARGSNRFGIRATSLSCGSLFVCGVVLAVITIQQSRWQTDFVLSRLTQETSRILGNTEDMLKEILSNQSVLCTKSTNAALRQAAAHTAFVLEFGVINGAGEQTCSGSGEPPAGMNVRIIPEGISYAFSETQPSSALTAAIVLKIPGGDTAYAQIDMASLRWYLTGFTEGRDESVILKLDGRELLHKGSVADDKTLVNYESHSFDPYYLIEARIASGRQAIATGFVPLAGFILGGSAIILVMAILVGDLRARERRDKQIAEAESKARSEFLATMSHEIRTPLNGLLGNIELLRLQETKHDRILDDAYTSSKMLLAIINDVLDMSKIESGGMQLNLQPVNLQELLTRTVKVHAANARGKQLTISIEADAGLDRPVSTDPIRLQQILSNLLSNAIKFTDSGAITLSAAVEDDTHGVSVRFAVRDTGCGIDRNLAHRLFEPFYQLPSNVRANGTGLGLSICNRLVSLLGGTLQFDSEIGHGSEFYFTIRFVYADTDKEFVNDSRARYFPRSSIALPAADPRPILTVDDHPLAIELLARQLELLGLQSVRALSKSEALKKYRSDGPFAAIITDENMPGGNGTELLSEIRMQENGKQHIPIILCTADITAQVASLVEGKILDGLLFKPYELEDLKQVLGRHIVLPNDFQSEDESTSDIASAAPAIEWSGGNLQDLLTITRGDISKAADILEQLSLSTQADQENLEKSIDSDDAPAATQSAHRIKGTAQMVGALQVAELSRSIEHHAKGGHLDDCRSVLAELKQANAELREFAEALRSSK